MSTFRRRGHWRSTVYGPVWVSEHLVSRDEWSSFSMPTVASWSVGSRFRWTSTPTIDRGPNALCPRCGDPVYFVRPANGGAIWLDEMGPPWPKHPCMDEQLWSSSTRPERPTETLPPTPVPPGWISSTGEIEATWDEKWGCWAFVSGDRQFASARQPPQPLSPVYARLQARRPYGVVQFMSRVGEGVDTIELSVTTYAAMKAALNGRKPALTDADWEMVARWIAEAEPCSLEEAEHKTHLLRTAIESLLRPGWSSNTRTTDAVKSAIQAADLGSLRIERNLLYKWVRLFLSC